MLTAGLANVTPDAYLSSMYGDGAKGYFDYLAFHPYSWPNSPEATGGFNELVNMNQVLINNSDAKKIIVTEVGWPSTIASGGVDEATQASYIQQVFQDIEYEEFTNVPIACIYDFLDDGTDQTNPENNFGLLRADYSQKPSFATVQSVRSDYNAHFIPINP